VIIPAYFSWHPDSFTLQSTTFHATLILKDLLVKLSVDTLDNSILSTPDDSFDSDKEMEDLSSEAFPGEPCAILCASC
jgi:hypothetical protein